MSESSSRDARGALGAGSREAPRLPAWAERPRRGRDLRMHALWLLTVIAFLAPRMFITIESGQAGVVFHRWGGTAVRPEAQRGEGISVIAPWDVMSIYELRLQRSSEPIQVLSKEGLEVRMQATILYRPIKEEVGLLHRDIGPDYLDRVIRPEAQAILRVLSSRRTAEEIYTSPRDLQADALLAARQALADRHVSVESLLVTDIVLPEVIKRAIDEKQRQAQVALEYDSRIVQAEKEATRKEIEARGVQAFHETATRGMSETFLRWRTIEASAELARSPGSRLIVLGGPAGTAPLVLNVPPSTTDPAAAATAAPQAPAPAMTTAAPPARPPPGAGPPD